MDWAHIHTLQTNHYSHDSTLHALKRSGSKGSDLTTGWGGVVNREVVFKRNDMIIIAKNRDWREM